MSEFESSLDLRIVDAEVVEYGDVWFELDTPVKAVCTEAGRGRLGEKLYGSATSREWIIELYWDDDRPMDYTVVSPAEGRELCHDESIVYTDEPMAPRTALALFTHSIVEVDP